MKYKHYLLGIAFSCVLFAAGCGGGTKDNSEAVEEELPIQVGVVEFDKSDMPSLRMLFEKSDKGWSTFTKTHSDPQKVLKKIPEYARWSVLFRGDEVGDLKTGRPKTADVLSSIGVTKIIGDPNNELNPVETKTLEWGFWEQGHNPVYRPLIALGNTTEKINPIEFGKIETSTIEQLLKSESKPVTYSILNEDGTTPEAELSFENVDFFDSSYELDAEKKQYLIALRPNAKGRAITKTAFNKQFPKADYTYLEAADAVVQWNWYFYTPGKTPKLLGTNLSFMDGADFDGDGENEYMFFISDYNLNGYMLFWDNFEKSATFDWNYH